MRLRYEDAPDVAQLLSKIMEKLNFSHIPRDRVLCFRSHGSKTRYVVARVHSLPRIWQQGLEVQAHYAVEVLAEKYDRLPTEEKEKILIHELLHIPRGFGGGFRHHRGWVTRRRIESLHLVFRQPEMN
jgi:predicted metallopeptidase